MEAKSKWDNIFKVLKGKTVNKESFPAMLPFISEGRIKIFSYKQILRKYVASRYIL